MIDGIVCGLLTEERDLERASPRQARAEGSDLREDVIEEIAQRRRTLGLARPPPAATRGRCKPSSRARLDTREPERRLADPRLPLQHERGSPALCLAEELMDRGEVFLPADDRGRHLPRQMVPRSRGKAKYEGGYMPIAW